MLEESQKDPLRPPVIVVFRRRDLAIPVISKSQKLQLLANLSDALLRRYCGVDVVFDRILLGR